ncbi:ABC-2 transporter permease [Peptacetobacter hominis]|nr:ABC-2 transporter permease [Peptacetobacter hominis]
MINLIKKDIIVYIKSERIKMFKYLIAFLLMYLFLNDISYYGIPVIFTYFIMIGIFSGDSENKSIRFIRSMPVKLDEIVYSRYLMCIGTLISSIIVTDLVCNFLSNYMFRPVVMNDVFFAVDISLVIMSIAQLLFFRFGYDYIKIAAAGIGIAVFVLYGSFLKVVAEKVYLLNAGTTILKTGYYETDTVFTQMFEGVSAYINTTFINMYSMTVLAFIIYLISMRISIKFMNGNRYIK